MWEESTKFTFSEKMFSVRVKGKNYSFPLVMLENIGLIIQSDMQMQEIKLKVFAVELSSRKMCITL